jgi:hypothetical protein
MTSPHIIRVVESRRIRQTWQIAHAQKMRSAYKISARTLKGKRPLGKCKHRQEDKIKKDLMKTELQHVD